MSGAPGPADAPTSRAEAAGLRAGGPPDAETVKAGTSDQPANDQKFPPGAPPWRRATETPAEPSPTTEVYRPATGVSVASHPSVSESAHKPPNAPSPGGPRPFGPGGLGGPGGQPGNGQLLPNPFGGSGGPEPMRRNEPGPHRPPLGRPTAPPLPPLPP